MGCFFLVVKKCLVEGWCVVSEDPRRKSEETARGRKPAVIAICFLGNDRQNNSELLARCQQDKGHERKRRSRLLGHLRECG